MKEKPKFGVIIAILSLIVMSLACGLTGGSEPTAVPAPIEPTAAPVEPTAIPTEPPVEAPTPTEIPEAEPTEAVMSPESAAPTDQIYVSMINNFRDDFGALHVIGLVTNNTSRSYDNVEVEIEILDMNDYTLLVDTTSVLLYKLAPGETSPFSYYVFDELPDAYNYVATVVGQSASEFERATVDVEGVTFVVDDGGDLHLTGNLVNNTDAPLEISSLAAATFDGNGEIYSANSHSVLVRYLDPGEDGPFRVTMTGPADAIPNIDEFEIYVDAVVTDPTDSFDLAFSDSHHNYVDAYDFFHLVGEITNNSNENLTISLVAGIYDADGNVIDAATTDIPTFSIAPGLTLPYDFKYWGPLNYKAGTIDVSSSYTVQWDPYWTWTSSTEYIQLTTQNDSNQVGSYQITFEGEVRNNSGQDVDGATIIVTLYDIATGQLVATGYGGIYEPFTPNQTAAYTVWVDIPVDFDFNTVEYEISAWGDLP